MTMSPTAFESKPIVFRLYFQDQRRLFLLDAFFKNKPIAIKQAVAKLAIRSKPAVLENANSGQIRLSPSQFLLVRDWLMRLSTQIDERKAVCAVDGIANRLQAVPVPSWFRFLFVHEGDSLVCTLPDAAQPLDENGWFLCGEEMWHCDLRQDEAEHIWAKIEGRSLVRFLRDTLPDWTKRGIPFECPLSYSQQPCVKITIERVEQDSVAIARNNLCTDLRPTEVEGLAFAGAEVRPTLQDALYCRLFSEGDSCLLKGETIPEFVCAAQGPWAAAVEGDLVKLNQMHAVYEKAELLLLGTTTVQNGVGQALARPVLFAGGQYFDATLLTRSFQADAAYARIDSGYVPVSLLTKLGIGRTDLPEYPYKLKMEELIYRGSSRLEGPWSRMVFPDFTWGESSGKPLLQHLNFLAKWGFNGGVLGGAKNCAQELVEFIAALLERAPECRVMIVGKKTLLTALADVFTPLNPLILDGGKKVPSIPPGFTGAVLAAVSTLGNVESLAAMPFDVVIMLEPENIVKSNTSEAYQQLHRIKAQLRLAIYSDFMFQPKMQWVQQSLLGISSDIAARYAILDPAQPMPKLPPPHKFTAAIPVGRSTGAFASVEISGGASAKSVPIPPRESRPQTMANSTPTARMGFEVSEQRFVKSARELVNKVEQTAVFMPFMTYWPTYESMTDAQARWYFYWRNEVRQQRYPHTDSSYIYLYTYELLNLIGCDTPEQGYYLIMGVWRAYRSAFPKLNGYLGNWMTDFVLLHQLDVPIQEVLSLCGNTLSGELLDMELYRRFCAEPVELDVPMLAHTADYDITRSKFYQSMHSLSVDVMLPKVIALVDAYLKKQQGQRIVELYYPGQYVRVRYAFRSAIYAGGAREIKVPVVPLSTHAPLRDFLAQVTRFAENKLREIAGFAGRLRGIELDAPLQKLIALYLERELSAKEKEPTAPKLSIDRDKLARLTVEAEQTQRLLSIDTQPETLVEPFDAAADLLMGEEARSTPLSDLPAMTVLVAGLTAEEKRLLDALSEAGWEVADEALQQKLPELLLEHVVHTINEKAFCVLGSLLIVQEGSKKLIDDDYRGDLERIYNEPSLVHAHAAWNASALDDSWKTLVDNLSPWQLDMLFALAHVGEKDELLDIAIAAGSMVELLIDGINEASMAYIGDLLIQDSAILAEYKQTVQLIFNTKERAT